MAPIVLLLLVTSFVQPLALPANKPAAEPTSLITVVGVVYCDTCSTNTFSKHSYFLPGVDVHIQCIFKANAQKTREQMNFSVNRTTDQYGGYKLEVPEVDGVYCVEGLSMQSQCQATLIRSKDTACNFPGLKTATNEISVKSKQEKLCIYSLNALSYRPSKNNTNLCGNFREELQASFNSSKFFLPYFPPYGFPWHPLPQLPPVPYLPPLPPLPPIPPLPPLPSLPLPPLPPFLPFPYLPFPSPPSLPFPFAPLPPFPPTPFLPPPPPPPQPAFNLGDPRTWFPHFPSLSAPPPPAFTLGYPKTWIPHLPSLSPPSQPPFDLRDPRTWIPHFRPSPPYVPHEQKTP